MTCVHCVIVFAPELTGCATAPQSTAAWAVGPADPPSFALEQFAADWSADPVGVANEIGTLPGAIIAEVLRWL